MDVFKFTEDQRTALKLIGSWSISKPDLKVNYRPRQSQLSNPVRHRSSTELYQSA